VTDTTPIQVAPEAQPPYGRLLLLLLIWTVVATLQSAEGAMIATVGLLAVALIYTFSISRASRILLWVAIGIGVVGLISAFTFGGDDTPDRLSAIPALFGMVFAAAIPVLILREIGTTFTINRSVIAGALAIFLAIATFFAYAVFAIQSWTGEYFSDGMVHPFRDTVYFSYITITTTGYGDLAPVTPLGRLSATIEALVGQIYLVTVVSLVVGNLGRQAERQRRSRK
jgi:hypothetical protein